MPRIWWNPPVNPTFCILSLLFKGKHTKGRGMMPIRSRDLQFLLSLLHFFGLFSQFSMAQPAKNYMRLYVNGAPTDYLGPQIGTAEANSLLASQDDEELPIVVIPSRNRRDLFLPSEDTIIRKRAVDHLARFSRNLPEQEQMYQIQNVGDLPMFRFG
uniref:DUF3048 domain-containing protein n=1 Tax=Bursaphelenchus xylophilus TaxID=6326 RepID=A0A1I7RRF8_BURXY